MKVLRTPDDRFDDLPGWGHEPTFLTAFSDGDPVTAGGERTFQHKVPGAHGQPHVTVAAPATSFRKTPEPNSVAASTRSSGGPRERRRRHARGARSCTSRGLARLGGMT